MSQSSSATTLLKAPEVSLKVGLQSVLQSLDIQLEDELVRYRRERRRQAQAEKLKAQQALATQAAATLAPATETAADVHEAAATSEAENPALAAAADAPGSQEHDAIAPDSSSSALVRQADIETDDQEEEDYFASSAALLESLGTMPEDDLEGLKLKSEETSFLKQLMTPTGVGASLLVLAAGAVSGYLMMNPSSVSHLRFAELFPSAATPEAESVDSSGVATTVKEIPAELPPGAPDLTQREFVQLSLSNLGNLDPDGNPIHHPSGLGLAGLANGSLTVATAQPLPVGITQSAGGGGTAPGGAATLPNASFPQVIQPIPQSGLLSSLSDAVSGRSTAEQMISETPLPAVVSPVAPAPAAVAAAPVITPMEVTQLPIPEAEAPAPVAVAPAAVEEPVEEYVEEYVPPAPEAEISYWEPEAIAPEPIVEPATEETIVETYEAVEPYVPASYIVVAPYISDAALADIQAVVPDAYVENYDTGAYIQAGVFDDAASAGDLLMLLQDQGISASVENR